jgi:hypothetical protein
MSRERGRDDGSAAELHQSRTIGEEGRRLQKPLQRRRFFHSAASQHTTHT